MPRVPIKNIGGHGPTGGGSYAFGLEPDVHRDGWYSRTLRDVITFCAQRSLPECAIWMKDGTLVKDGQFSDSTYSDAVSAGIKLTRLPEFANWISDMNSDANCIPLFYLPPLPSTLDKVTGNYLSLHDWLNLCEHRGIGWIKRLRAMDSKLKYNIVFDVLGAETQANMLQGPTRFYYVALLQSLVNHGIGVGIEPFAQYNTFWLQPELRSHLLQWVTPWYLTENVKGNPQGRWSPTAGIVPSRVYVNQTPEYQSYDKEFLRAGYNVLTPIHVWDESVKRDSNVLTPVN